jgi:hypothetical protein
MRTSLLAQPFLASQEGLLPMAFKYAIFQSRYFTKLLYKSFTCNRMYRYTTEQHLLIFNPSLKLITAAVSSLQKTDRNGEAIRERENSVSRETAFK